MNDILADLNQAQIEAVKTIEGPLLVLAGAGSGKTKALTHRIAFMIREMGIKPWNILAVTFTNKAANEMRQRISTLLHDQKTESDFLDVFGAFDDQDLKPSSTNQMPHLGTFHAVCVRILRRNIQLLDHENSFVIYDTADQNILIKRVMKSLRIDTKKVNPKAVLHHISQAKNQLIKPEEYRQYASDYFSEKVADIYPYYQDSLKQNNALDFDDIIMKCVELFERYPDVLELYQNRFKYLAVDEYQDTNKAQYRLIQLLASKYRNICVIGDADQSIYGWRGATIANILNFEKDYPEAKVIALEQNYRSSQNILDAAHQVIKNNRQRKEKKLWTDKGQGAKVRHWLCDNERHEGEMLAREIVKQCQGQEVSNYNRFAVLYRTNAQSRVLEEVLLRYGLPYRLVGGIRFYERKEIKDILAYLRVIQNPHDSVSLLRIINAPARKIGPKTIETVREFADQNNISFYNGLLLSNEIDALSKSKQDSLLDFVCLIKDLQALNQENSASAMIKYVLENSGYKKLLSDKSVEAEARLENIGELVNVAKKYDGLEPAISLNIFLEEVSLISDVDKIQDSDNAVTLMTVHSAKGLEFNDVFIVGLEEGIFPHNRSLFDPSELEEERRLMYVAMTRAKENLYLLHARSRSVYGKTQTNIPSQFLDHIVDDLLERNFTVTKVPKKLQVQDLSQKPIPLETVENSNIDQFGVGDRVHHSLFGKGIISNVTGGVATIIFEDRSIGMKKLALSIAPLKKI
jgi:DNA helicase-2/ATP-dependent DNA helicase PcrA